MLQIQKKIAQVFKFAIALIVATFSTSLLPTAYAYATPDGNNSNQSNNPPILKDWVCKYVGTPGVNETLKNGNDGLVWVDTNATEGSYFNDAQGRSYVLKANAPHEPKPNSSGCPTPQVQVVQYMTVVWKVADTDNNGDIWEQKIVGNVATSTPSLNALDYLLVNTECNGYQVDVYQYTNQADKTKVDNLIAGGVLYGPNNPPEPLIPGGTGVAYKLVGKKGICPMTVTPCVEPLGSTVLTENDFIDALSDTRATGHYEFTAQGLHIWTEGSSSTDKVAEYWTINTSLQNIGTPMIDYTNNGGGTPGLQLVVDFNNDGTADGILVGESVYGNDWWLSNGSAQFVKDGAPSHTGGSGSANHGTLDQWLTNFPHAQVKAAGFSLGSGVKGDGIIKSMTFGCVKYTFKYEVKKANIVAAATCSANGVKVTLTNNGNASGTAYVNGQDFTLAAGETKEVIVPVDANYSAAIKVIFNDAVIYDATLGCNPGSGGGTPQTPQVLSTSTTVSAVLPATIPATGTTTETRNPIMIVFAALAAYGAVYFLQGRVDFARKRS